MYNCPGTSSVYQFIYIYIYIYNIIFIAVLRSIIIAFIIASSIFFLIGKLFHRAVVYAVKRDHYEIKMI